MPPLPSPRTPIAAALARATFTARRARAALACAALACTALAGCGGSDGEDPPVEPPGSGAADVFTPGNVFSPFSTTIRVGGTVRFNIGGAQHNVSFDRRTAGVPADIPVVENVVVARTFGTRGTFAYECTVHPGMSGQVVVQ